MDTDGNADQHSVQCTLPGNSGAPYDPIDTPAIVTFSDNPHNPTGSNRVFQATAITTAP